MLGLGRELVPVGYQDLTAIHEGTKVCRDQVELVVVVGGVARAKDL